LKFSIETTLDNCKWCNRENL